LILDEIVKKKRISVTKAKEKLSMDVIKKEALKIVNEENKGIYKNTFLQALKKDKLSIIGEFKKASPSKGIIVQDFDIMKILEYYEYMGIDAFSILTEEDYFKGKDEYIKSIASKSSLPILRKDFIIDFYQIYEAKVLGASGILLIASVLKEELGKFYDEAKKFNLEPLVEVHNKEELNIALKFDCNIIGVNNRDLKTFKVSLETGKELTKLIPKEKIKVFESGIMDFESLNKAREYGADAALIGEFFMRNIDNENFKDEYRSSFNV